jgi:hypothetical protein
VRKPLAHLLLRLTDKSVVGTAHGDEGLEALDKNVLLLAPMSGSSRGLRSSTMLAIIPKFHLSGGGTTGALTM